MSPTPVDVARPTLVSPGDLVRDIAAGLGLVTAASDAPPAETLTRELVLDTPAYDVWVMHWPAGQTAALHAHPQHVAFHVVRGFVHEVRHTADGVVHLELHEGDTSVVAPDTPHRVTSAEPTVTVHVHAKAI